MWVPPGGAKANCQYYASEFVGASAHYYVDIDGSVWQSVEDRNIAWHSGRTDGIYKHPECRNTNSIGIELCVRFKGDPKKQYAESKDWYLFGPDGAMLTGWQRWNGRIVGPEDPGDWYFLDNTAGGPLEGACWHERPGGYGAWEIWRYNYRAAVYNA